MSQWNIDPAHTSAEFSVKHMMITTVRGGFSGVEGVITYDPANLAASAVTATIPAASIDTGVTDRNNHLKSADFFDVETFPTIEFRSTGFEAATDTSGTLTGELTMHGITREVKINVEYIGESKNPMTGDRTIGFEGTTTINREDFDLTWNVALETGGVLVGKEIKIMLGVQAVLVQETVGA